MNSIIHRTVVTAFAMVMALALFAGPKEIRSNGVVIGYGESLHPGRVHSVYAKNNASKDISLYFINEYDNGSKIQILLKKGATLNGSAIDITFNALEIQPVGVKRPIEIFRKSSPLAKTDTVQKAKETVKEEKVQPVVIDTIIEKADQRVVADFCSFLDEKVPYYALSGVSEDSTVIHDHIDNLNNWSDRAAYIQNKGLDELLHSMSDSLAWYEQKDSIVIMTFLKGYKKTKIANSPIYVDSMKTVLEERRSVRKHHLQLLKQAMEEEDTIEDGQIAIKVDWKMVGVSACMLLLLVVLVLWYRNVRRRQKAANVGHGSHIAPTSNEAAGIIVRNTTATVLRKQNLDDVIDNNDYLKISCSEFCADSAVRYMYFKNSCIRDIYNLYAEDLRNPDNPKEDGCMVLGRWVHDEKTGQYDVSLEQIILPGNDAVFAEYELNFGGKIKMKMSEQLRRLRRETNLQYDLTCWVHSHPGLTVFFSNSDNNVHMQLKHPTHPNFLTAIVVDILTPEQEFGIFTFRNDSTLNSKSDLTKMYSLEVMYKWAVSSLRTSFKAEDHFNTLTQVKNLHAECHAIHLSNGAIIDMGMLTAESSNGQIALVHGFLQQYDDKTEYVVAKVDRAEVVPDNEVIGCFVIAAHCSIPSIRKTIASHLGRVHFVLVYTPSDDLLTSIPVIQSDLSSNEDSYGEQKLEDLKIWTRRKR